MNRLVLTDCVDPWQNLAVEEHLFDTQQEQGITLYLWQNQNTVVIGRCQNAWKECRAQLLESEGGKLARRSSGGGAVFHDLGNLNFTFLTPRNRYDLDKQLSVLQRSVSAFGLETKRSGRNDVVLAEGGGKFSGNAFRFGSQAALHHGTILICGDMEKLSRYLAPSQHKMAAKGIDSVRARVCNLSQGNPAITVAAMVEAMTSAFEEAYGPFVRLSPEALDPAAIAGLYERHASWEWRFGKTPAFDIALSHRFSWGEVELLLTCKKGHVESCTVYTDAMDPTLAQRIARRIENAPFTPDALGERMETLGEEQGIPEDMAQSLARWIRERAL